MRPMLATPTPTPPSGSAWRHEIKWDGIRAIVTVDAAAARPVTIRTRSGADCTDRFPEIATSHLADFDDLVLDGEIVAMTEGTPDFHAVMQRLSPRAQRLTSPVTPRQTARVPVQYMVFDVLRAAGHDVTRLPWTARRQLLEGAGIVAGAVDVPATHADGAALFTATREAGIEGVVSKRVDAPYRPGVRSEDWLKSVHRTSETFIVGGWRPVAGTLGQVGAILVGEMVDEQLRYRGRVGTGFSRASGQALLEWLTPSPERPFTHPEDDLPPADLIGTHWVRPEVSVDVMHLGRSHGGRLRQPAYKGLRLDVGVSHG